MASFVLVHGSGQNAGSWSRVAALLRERGHAVETPDLPKNEPDWGLADYATVIAAAVASPDTVVVGHSFSSAFLPLVPRVRACGLLVFFAGVVPEPGKSVREQSTADPTMFNRAWIDAGSRWFDEDHVQELAREFLFHDCDRDDLAWAFDSLEMLDTRHIVGEPCPLTAWPDVPCEHVVATADRTLTADWGRRIARRMLGREAIEIESGHCPQISRVAETAGLLERLAEHGQDRGAGA